MHDIPDGPERTLDIRRDTCPMTFVRTRLELDRMPPGAVLRVCFRGEEPRRNLARSLVEQGYAVLDQSEPTPGEGELRVRKPPLSPE